MMAANESGGLTECMPPPPTDATTTAEAAAEAGDFFTEGFDDDDLGMDLDQIMLILNEDQDSDHAQFQNIPEETQHSNPEESLVRSAIQVECPPHADFDKNSDFQSDFKETGGTPMLRTDVDAASSEMERPRHLVDSIGNSNTGFKPAELDLPVQAKFQAEASASFEEWQSMGSGSDYYCTNGAVHHPEYNMQGLSAVSTLADECAYQLIDCKDKMDPAWSNYDTKFQRSYMNYNIHMPCASECPIMEHPNVEFGQYGDFSRNCTGTSENLENNSYKSVEMSCLDADTSSRNATSIESVCQSSDGVGDWFCNNMVRKCSDNSLDFNPSWDQNHFTTCFKTSQSEEGMIMNSNRVGDSRNESASCSSRISSNALEEGADANGQRLFYNSGRYTSPIRGNFSDADSMSLDEAITAGSLAYSRPYMPGIAQTAPVKNVMQDSLLTTMDTIHRYAQTTEAAVSNRSMYDVEENPFLDRCSEQFSAIPQELETSPNDVSEGVISAGKRNPHFFVPQRLQSYPKHEDEVLACKRARHSYEMVDGVIKSSIDSSYMNVKASEPYLRCHPHSVFSKRDFTKDEIQSQPNQHSVYVDDLTIGPEFYNDLSDMDVKASEPYLQCHSHTVCSKQKFTKEESQSQPNQLSEYVDDLTYSPESYNGDTSGCNVQGEDDSDLCIIKEVSRPVCAPQSVAPGNSIVASRHAISSESFFPPQHSTISKAVGYSGVGGSRFRVNDERLVFRVALQDLSQPRSEASPPDGFLAVPLLRHQRIALSWMIQKETNSLHCSGGILADDQGLGKTVSTIALILKERPSASRVVQEDIQQGVLETLNLDEDDDSVLDKEKLEPTDKKLVQLKGRPAAGTLVVCPTSVLRQWAEELQNKVTSKAKLSVLVYHGSNRTKDPSELAKYDVVLTTYSIVSMEVPKQPFSDRDDHDKKDREVLDPTSTNASSSKRSNKKSSKKHKEKDSILIESLARPLAKVGWFRVILDEAQSIKNHKTQVARACWGLRAKRRWCLSGTPIQNTIDDLYSYFRFLRYDPYSVYKSFCNTIKFPISKNPVRGYKKLQAVLKTIMLRRTKGTLLDGKPIINLPPKFVELKKVEFSWKERDFYARLEADSRAQFAEYAAAGTVKQNYVNILLMLLRLRQACDHPLLVKKYDSGSAWKSSVEMLKKLPQERQQLLLNCLEGSMAICGICNDPPEGAVVSICGHVFCNQCISEHLTMDDRKCPATNCKERLSESCVFSKITLINSLSIQSGKGSLIDCPAAELAEKVGTSFEDGLFESSKIMAAIEVLQALRPQACAPSCNSVSESSDKNLNSLENSCDTQLKRFSNDASKDQNSNCPVKVFGEKAIVFSQWTRMLDLLEVRMKKSSIVYRRLDGTMSVTARDKAVKEFNTIPEVSVMIMSLKAASLGLNMVAACHVILLDLWWNPTTEDQAVDRAHRIGQTRPVKVLRLTVKNTVEDRILALQEKKREMVASAFGEDETGSSQSRLTVDDLKYLFMA